MTKTEYAIYLSSPEWKARRAYAIEYAGSECERCELPRWLAEIAYDQDLNVHHKTYRNRGSENVEDLEVLCRRCHEIETFGRSELRAPKKATCEACECTHWDYRSSLCVACDREGIGNVAMFTRASYLASAAYSAGDSGWHVFAFFALEEIVRLQRVERERKEWEGISFGPVYPLDALLVAEISNMANSIPGLYRDEQAVG